MFRLLGYVDLSKSSPSDVMPMVKQSRVLVRCVQKTVLRFRKVRLLVVVTYFCSAQLVI